MQKQKEYFRGKENFKIHYKKYEVVNEKAKIVISHGFSESLFKYRELIKIFNQNEYSVYILAHRGHGHSGRLGVDNSQINVDKFDYYVEDLKTFIDTIVKSNNSKLFLFGHSMGGCISGLFLERYPNYFDAAILNAPMMQIDTGKYPEFVSKIMANVMCSIGKGNNYVFGHHPFTGKPNLTSSGTSSEKRYYAYFNKQLQDINLQTEGASFNWLSQAFKATKEVIANSHKIQVPVLLFQAGRDTFVLPDGQNRFVANNAKCQLHIIEDAKHEIYIEKDDIFYPYIDKVLDFYKSNLSAYSTI